MSPLSPGFLDRLRHGLARTRGSLVTRVEEIFGRPVDEAFFDDLEVALLQADLGVETTEEIVQALRRRTVEGVRDEAALTSAFREELRRALGEPAPLVLEPRPAAILVLGVNGTGKTTTIGKLAHRLAGDGHRVVLAAADTFRAAAIDQLEIWAWRAGVEIVKHREGSDPAAVVFDAIQAAKARRADVVIADTAGRMHTKVNLMEELRKVRRVVDRELPGSAVESLLVLDATTGQNALAQARQFRDAVKVTGIVLTKLDGTAKGGVVVAIARSLGIPVKFVGTGERLDDLQPFDPGAFVDALFAPLPARFS